MKKILNLLLIILMSMFFFDDVFATNSYGMKNGSKESYIYKIILTPESIEAIRDYNKENVYDNYTLCSESDCVSKNKFLDTYIKLGVIGK